MFAKSLLAAAAVSGALVLASAGAAQADPHVHFGIGIGLGGPGWGGDGYDGGEPYWHHRHHWDDHRWDEPAPIMSYGISCGEGRNIVAESGFHGVSAISCGGPAFRYIGWRHGERFRIAVNRRGNIIGVSPVY